MPNSKLQKLDLLVLVQEYIALMHVLEFVIAVQMEAQNDEIET